MKRPSSVIIIGAGAAGWSAAQKLVDAGISVLMVEARSRIGGRVFTVHNSIYPTDMGAEFVHTGGDAIKKILPEQGAVLPITKKHTAFWQNQRFDRSDFWKKISPILETIKVHQPDRPISDFICEVAPQLNDFEKAMLTDYIEGFNAADVYEMSESAMALEDGSTGLESDARVVKGYDQLFDPFRRLQESPHFELLLNTQVELIEWKMGEVKIVSELNGAARTDYASAVILTVPSSIIANQNIDFYPALDEKVEAAKNIAIGPVYKVVMTFREAPFQAGADVEFIHSPELTFGTRWIWGLYDSKVVVSWSAGHRAEKLMNRSREEIIARALADLETSCHVPKNRLLSIVETIDFHDWQNDPYSQGAYSYVKVGGVGAREQLAESVANTLFFAGEATMSDGTAGTVHGALRSGERAAAEILALPE